jgi:hypothetical protein
MYFARLATIISAFIGVALVSLVAAVPTADNLALSATLGSSLTAANYYGAPIPPWKKGAKAGWYYGEHPDKLGFYKYYIPHLKDGVSIVNIVIADIIFDYLL